MNSLLQALFLQAGYNAALVAIGAGLTGFAAGMAGVFVLLRKRALVSDAMAHATLPGVALAFLIMIWAGGDGRALWGLMLGAALSAGLGLLLIDRIARHTRLSEDAAIGVVLSSFFGAGIVLLTVVQVQDAGQQAGLETFFLGSTAGMLRVDALTIAAGGAIVALALWLFRRPFTLMTFDPGQAQALGLPVRLIDLGILALALLVTVTGLRLVGLVLVVALLIIPAVTARFWTDRVDRMLLLAGLFGALAGWLGAGLSAAAPNLPAGPMIALVAAGLFALSLAFAPRKGALASALRARRLSGLVHRRQGLLALARQETIHDRQTLAELQRLGAIRPDGVATETGRAAAARALRDEARWAAARDLPGLELPVAPLWPLESLLTADQLAEVDRRLGPPRKVEV